MSYPVTEIAYIPIKDGIDLESGEGKGIWDATLKTIASQKGFKRLSWGKQIETPRIAQMAIDWETLDAHKAFVASEPYGPFLDELAPILEGTPHLFHVKLPVPTQESETAPFDAPMTECISLYFDPSIDGASYDKSFASFVAEAGKVQGSEATGLIGGWGVEMHKVDSDGDEKKFFGTFIGWPSVESHMEFRKKEDFSSVVAHLRKGVEKVKMHHVAFKRFEA
ncbi:uncharacterized protein M421DRAFT_425648 [Didymella exigua CBS 183.55]|uniref:ABM domain-containing protein n=1 Tax=Didymella exigua CBS 183.55 TaxID=1150837 RepID=A0A6A5R612_9PLEO|nr:uncharacterized protein M421DRAFT_425648 [Didymella exigua CBS 183.55]KAF1923591.1 hypothetical protein M421DRAFT_425648 [Didymella exigua CBS 183.55]